MRVRVLLDHLGNAQYPGYRRTVKRLNAMGIEWRRMLPFRPSRGQFQRPDLRNHRKLLVVDGEVAFTGSQNVVETGYQRRKNHRRGLHWKDYMARFEGPVVAGIDALFVTDWYSETNELLEREAAPARKPGEKRQEGNSRDVDRHRSGNRGGGGGGGFGQVDWFTAAMNKKH